MPNTERAKYRATVKEFGDGTPFIVFEPMGDEITSLENQLVALDLRPGTTYEQARALADQLDESVEGLAVTALR
jgi:hypothetical protein